MSTAFPSRLSLEPVEAPDGRSVTEDGRTEWELERSFSYVRPDGSVIVVPAGARTDLASVPRPFTNLVAPDGPWVRAAVVHDYLYRTRGIGGAYSRAQADAILREAALACGASPFYANLLYAAVRVGGWRGWGS